MLWSKSWRSSILEITDRKTSFIWADFSIWSPRDCGNFGNAEGFDLKPCTCSSFGSFWRPAAFRFVCESTDQLQFLSELEYLRIWTNFFLCCCYSITQWCLFATPWTAATHQASLSLKISQFAQVHVHCIGDAIRPSHPLMPSSSFKPWDFTNCILLVTWCKDFLERQLEDRFTCFSTLLIANRILSIKLTLWVRLLTASFILSSLSYFHLWYSPGALFTSSKKLWRYRISCFKLTPCVLLSSSDRAGSDEMIWLFPMVSFKACWFMPLCSNFMVFLYSSTVFCIASTARQMLFKVLLIEVTLFWSPSTVPGRLIKSAANLTLALMWVIVEVNREICLFIYVMFIQTLFNPSSSDSVFLSCFCVLSSSSLTFGTSWNSFSD